MTAGRPTKYNGDVLNKTKEYVLNYHEYGDVVPSIAGLAMALGVSRETIYAWSKDGDRQEFSDTVRTILANQEKILLKNGLTGEFNPTITKLVLANHGYHDKLQTQVIEQDLDDKKVDTKQLARRILKLVHDAATGK